MFTVPIKIAKSLKIVHRVLQVLHKWSLPHYTALCLESTTAAYAHAPFDDVFGTVVASEGSYSQHIANSLSFVAVSCAFR